MRPVAYEALRQFVRSALERYSVPAEDAAMVAECLLYANLSGVDSHGIVHLEHYLLRLANGTIKAKPDIRFSQPRPAMIRVDGDDGLGHVVTARAIDRALSVCRSQGSAVVVVENSSHFGMAGYHVRRFTDANLVGMIMTHTDARIVPTGARTPFVGTNPIAFGFPAAGEPVVLDIATSVVPFGKICVAATEGRSIPADWGLDKEGEPTTDAHKVVGLHPIAGHKGSGLAIIIDLFCAMFSGMPFGPHINRMFDELEARRKLGHFIALWDIAALVPIDELKRRMRDYIAELHGLPRKNQNSPLYFPGEPEALKRQERLASGIPIEPGLLRDLRDLGRRLGLSVEALA